MAGRVYDHLDWPVIRGVTGVTFKCHLCYSFKGTINYVSADICWYKEIICIGRYNTHVYWNHSNQTICSTFTVNKAGSKIDAHAVVTIGISSAFLRSKGISKRTGFLKDGLAKYDVSAG